MRILLVDDDAELCALLGEFLRREGVEVSAEHDGPRGLDHALRGDSDLVVLDVMLPGVDGFEILRRLRARSRVPVIMLTARAEDVDRIVGLELGADDYLGKPFNPRELAARIRAIVRRLEPRPQAGAPIEVNGIRLDPAARNVTFERRPVDLTTLDIALETTNGSARIRVRDCGPGVPEESLARIFDPFYRVPADRNRASGGTGLGLAIARRAVELHGGSIAARNADPGLEVDIDLPVATAVVAP